MKQLKFIVQIGAATIVTLLAPALLLNIAKMGVPRFFVVLVALAKMLIPIEIALLSIYFNGVGIRALLNGMRLHSRREVIKALLILLIGDLLISYAFITSLKVCWL